jgi:hypothetical protein
VSGLLVALVEATIIVGAKVMVGGRCSRRRGGSSNVGRKRGGISGSKRGRIALSSTESEYLALSTALRDVIPLMGLIRVMRAHGFNCQATHPKVHCRAFEDNSTVERSRSQQSTSRGHAQSM